MPPRQDLQDAPLDAIDARNARVAEDVNGGGAAFDLDGHDGAVWAAALLDAGWPLADVERQLPDVAMWNSEREREAVEAAAGRIRRPWGVLSDMAEQAAREARKALRAAAPVRVIEDSWAFADLSDVAAPEPVGYALGPLAERVVYAEGLTTLVGHGDSGKAHSLRL